MTYLISCFWFALEQVYFYLFYSAFLPRKGSKWRILYASLLVFVVTSTYMNTELISILRIFISLFLYLTVICLLFEGSWSRRIFITILAFIINSTVDAVFSYGISALLGLSLEEFVWRKAFYVATVSMGKVFSVFLSWILHRYRLFRDFPAIEKKWLILSLFFPIGSLAMLLIVFQSHKGSSDLSMGAVVLAGFLMLANVAILYLINIMEKSTKNARETALMQQQMEIQTDSILALEKNYRSQRKATHDFRNQLQTIHDLLTNHQIQDALEYVRQLQGMQTIRVLAVNSHHPIIDAILNHKYQAATEQEIDVQIQVNDLSAVTLSTDILVVLLTNLLDNAIEACCRMEHNRVIECRFFATDSIYMSIRNTSNPVAIANNHIPTSKEPKEDHGYGLTRVQHILQQLSAEYTFNYENGWFEFVAEIPKL